jgi:sterol desaturase/sphingolipid hydroxylase (fatty acid hydroxylase superfamily)
MDASTAIRFHFGEMVISTGLQTFQILTIGVSPLTFSIWKTWLVSEVIFHHSNVDLPFALERWLSKIIVTPRMHGIHHSLVPEELNSNWSSGLTLWDRIHRTLRLNVPQNQLALGVAAYPDASEITYPKLLGMPIGEQRYPPWVRPDGTVPHRDQDSTLKSTILVPDAAVELPVDSPATWRL